MFKGFKEFILRGNVMELAVAFVVGAAFTALIKSIVDNLFTPVIGAVFNAKSLDAALVVTITTLSGNEAKIQFGTIIAAVIQFIIVAAVVYFVFVVPMNHLSKMTLLKRKAEELAAPDAAAPTETELLIQIRDLLAGAPSGGSQTPSGASGAHSA